MSKRRSKLDPAASRYLRSIQRSAGEPLIKARLAGALHGVILVLSLLALSAWLVESINLGHIYWPGLGWVISAFALRALLGYLSNQFAQSAGQLAEQAARQRLAVNWMASEDGRAASNAERANLMVEPVAQLYAYFARYLPQLSHVIVVPLTVLAVVFYLDWIAALFLLFAAPIIPIFMALVGMGAERLNMKHIQTTQRLAGLFVDRVRGLTNLQLFGATDSAIKDISHAGETMRSANMATLKIAFLSSAVLEFFAAVAIAAVAIYVGFSLLGFFNIGPAAEMTFFAGLTILLLAPEFFQPLRTLSAYYHDRAAALAAAQLLAMEDMRAGDTVNSPVASAEHSLELVEVSYSYIAGRPVIDNFSAAIAPGSVVLLNGPSGTGKSTFLKLLSGQIRLQAGDICYPPGSHIAYMAQQPYISSGTLADNLTMIKTDATAAQMQQALKSASLELPLDTAVLEQGQGLSGGEQRRLALARMHLNPAPLMLFDEPTASLDEKVAADVRASIQSLLNNQRILIIASHDPVFADFATHCITTFNSGPESNLG